jgi:adenylate kinase family enzyme
MIIGITGAICAGKRAFAEYLAAKYGFELVNLLDLFRGALKKQGYEIEQRGSPTKSSGYKSSEEEYIEESEESKTFELQAANDTSNPELSMEQLGEFKLHGILSSSITKSSDLSV